MEGNKPFGIHIREPESVDLIHEKYEALNFADYENYTLEETAKKMKTHVVSSLHTRYSLSSSSARRDSFLTPGNQGTRILPLLFDHFQYTVFQ